MRTPLPFPAAPVRLTIALLLRLPCPIHLFAALGGAALAFVAEPSGAAVTEAWVQRYTSGDYEPQVTKVVCDTAGNIIVASEVTGLTNSDMLIIKYSGTDGSVLWQKLYNGPNTAGNSWDYPTGLAVDSSGNVVVTGPSYNAIYSYDYDYYTAKYAAANGALLWEKRYNGGTVSGGSSDTPSAVAVDGAGNVVVTGTSAASPTPGVYHNDYYTAKYAASNGALLWERRYNGPANSVDEAKAVAVDGSGNVVVTGTSSGPSSSYDYYTAKYAAANGALLWERRYNSPTSGFDQPRAVAVDSVGNAVVTGRSYNGTNDDYYTAKYAAANGALLWEQRYNGPVNRNDQGSGAAVDNNGDGWHGLPARAAGPLARRNGGAVEDYESRVKLFEPPFRSARHRQVACATRRLRRAAWEFGVSPAFQRWVLRQEGNESRQGRKNGYLLRALFRPSGACAV